MKPIQTLAAALALAAPMAAVQAHHFWLLPSATVLSKSAYITVDAAVANDLFYFNHAPLRLSDGFSVTAPDGSRIEPENLTQGKLRTVFDLNLTRDGTHRLALVNSGVMARWKEDGEPKRFRGKAEDFVGKVPANATDLKVNAFASRLETFVTLGKPTPIEPTGQGLELIPITHPNDLYAGETASFRLDHDGRPAVGVEVTLIPGGTRYRDQPEEIKVATDARGQIAVTWPQPGWYWLGATTSDAKTDTELTQERRLSYTATLQVLP